MMMRRIQVREYEEVRLAGLSHPARIRDALLAATAGLREAVFRVDRRGHLWSTGFVGIVEAAGVTVEMLPRAGTVQDSFDADAAFLLNLLSAARLIPQRMRQPGRLAMRSVPLFETVIRAAAEELQTVLLEHGPPRRFHEVEEEGTTILGSVDMVRSMRQLPSDRNRVPIRHAPLQTDNPLARLMLSLADHLRRATKSRRSEALLADAADQLAGAQMFPLSTRLAEISTPVAGMEDHWRSLHVLAAGLAKGLHPDPTRTGSAATTVLIFPLDDVFERILRRAIPYALRGSSLSLADGTPTRYLLRDAETGSRRLRLRPDYLLMDRGEPLLVADAKWKSLRLDRNGLLLTREDVFQVTAYMNRYGLRDGMLLFPACAQTRRDEGPAWVRNLGVEGSTGVIRAVSIDVPALVSTDRAQRDRAMSQLRGALVSTTRTERQVA